MTPGCHHDRCPNICAHNSFLGLDMQIRFHKEALQAVFFQKFCVCQMEISDRKLFFSPIVALYIARHPSPSLSVKLPNIMSMGNAHRNIYCIDNAYNMIQGLYIKKPN